MGNLPGLCNAGLCTTYPGKGLDIAASNFTTAVIGFSTQADTIVFTWDETIWGWHALPGGGSNLAAGPNSLLVAHSELGLWEWEGGDDWFPVFPYHEAQDVGVGMDGTVCYIGPPTSSADRRGDISCQAGGTTEMAYPATGHAINVIDYPETALRIDVKPDGNPVIVNGQGFVYQWIETSGWELMPGGQMQDVAVDPSGNVCAIKEGESDHYIRGGEVCRWDGSSFVVAGTGIVQAIRIAADSEKIWIIESDNTIITFPSW